MSEDKKTKENRENDIEVLKDYGLAVGRIVKIDLKSSEVFAPWFDGDDGKMVRD